MRKGDLDDPLLRQVLPLKAEHNTRPGYTADPLNEYSTGRSGFLQKYRGRALLITTGACPVHCRYCFRRHFPYADQLAARSDWQDAVDRLRSAPTIDEVILSGGDPLSLPNSKLADLIEKLELIGTVRTVRIHTRFPIVIPERVDSEFAELLESTKLQTVIVLHANHGNEIDEEVRAALVNLARSADLLLNQSVLLQGVNDSAVALGRLSRRLIAARVLPYYLHLLDKVQGSSHFEIDQKHARRIVDEMCAELPGYLVPKLVREAPGALSKVPIL